MSTERTLLLIKHDGVARGLIGEVIKRVERTGLKLIALEFLNNYKWSSYFDYKNKNRKESTIIKIIDFPKFFEGQKDFDEEILDWITLNPHD
jgi:nucleoside diphosphate kinase